MEVTITRRRSRDNSLETFIKDHGIQLSIEEDPTPVIPDQRFWVHHDPDLYVEVSKNFRFRSLMPLSGFGADIAVRRFMKSISGKKFKKDNSNTGSQICPKLEWDGILRLPLKARKAK
jgi:hypothetical protein